jgi:hypothetical protein
MAASGREDQSGAERRAAYALPGAKVLVDTDDPSLQCWLDEFLMPGFDPIVTGPEVPTVVVTAADNTASPSHALEPFGALPCFALDQGVIEHLACRSGDTVVVTDEKYGARYRIDPDSITVMRDDPTPRSRAAVMRVVRELATAQALGDGSRLQLHAAALEHDGRIIVLAGPKEAGKTTLTVRLASVGKLAVAGNDRILLTPSRGWSVRSIPTVVSVRPGTQAQMVGMFDDVPAVPSPAHLTMRELDALSDRQPPREPGVRLKLSPAQFVRAAGVSLSGEGRLGQVLLISVEPTLDGYEIERCTPQQSRAGLDAVRYGSRATGTPRTIFEDWLAVARPPDADRVLLDELAESVPVSTLRVGPRVLHDDGLAAELLGSVLAGG